MQLKYSVLQYVRGNPSQRMSGGWLEQRRRLGGGWTFDLPALDTKVGLELWRVGDRRLLVDELKQSRVTELVSLTIQHHCNVLHNNSVQLTLWHQLLPYGYSYKASCARPG